MILFVMAAGAAFAVSSGSYSSPQQDCPWYGSDWNTPQYQSYPGCHNTQLSIESGGTTNGNPDNGYNDSPTPGDHGSTNTTWVQFGNDQAANDPISTGTPTFWSIGYPGQSSSPHAGCLSVNTDGTDGGAAPAGTKPEPESTANSQQKYGCGNNPKGTGFDLNYDYYQYYCPIAAELPAADYPYGCEQVPGGDQGSNVLTTDTGTAQTLTTILTQGMLVYYGMDDNNNNTEHDGEGPYSSPQTQGSTTGASDGGGLSASLTPQSATNTPSLAHPEGLINSSAGFCADGNCGALTTQQDTVYQGCEANTGEVLAEDQCTGSNGPNSSRDVYNYAGKQWDPYNCSSGGAQGQTTPEPDSPAECDTSSTNQSPSGSSNTKGGEDYWRQTEAHSVNAEPGFQFYEDPDPQGSPATPIYPNPGIYVGTCGVVVGGGALPALPASPLTNSAGQLVISTGC
jgi:hypothetical protein